jgi:uncharacterized protein (DUF1501 family)
MEEDSILLRRREFLKCGTLLPLAAVMGPIPRPKPRDPILVVIELNGGNDGVNTVVPFRDEGYRRHRRELRLERDRLLTISDELGLHPGLRGFAALLERGELAVVQGLGYPDLNLSHEVSLATWHTACLDRAGRRGSGWLGRMLDGQFERKQGRSRASGAPAALLAGSHPMPGALRARRSSVATVPSLDAYLEGGEFAGDPLFRTEALTAVEEEIRRIQLDASATAHTIRAAIGKGQAEASYPATRLGADLQLVGRLIRAGLGTSVYYAIQSGYDHHSLQLGPHAARLTELGDGLLAFMDDVRAAGQHERVLVMVFSEFGRRVPENASRGTDHGTAGPLFLAGAAVNPGVHGQTPSLTDLVEGNLEVSLDFRRVYGTVLGRWLGLDPAAILGGTFEPLPLLRG